MQKILSFLFFFTLSIYSKSEDPFKPKNGYPNLDEEINCEELLKKHKYWQEAKETLTQEEKNELLKKMHKKFKKKYCLEKKIKYPGQMICAVCIGANPNMSYTSSYYDHVLRHQITEELSIWVYFPKNKFTIKFLLEYEIDPNSIYYKHLDDQSFKLLLHKGLILKRFMDLSDTKIVIALKYYPKQITSILLYNFYWNKNITEIDIKKIVNFCPQESLGALKSKSKEIKLKRSRVLANGDWDTLKKCDDKIELLNKYISQIEQEE